MYQKSLILFTLQVKAKMLFWKLIENLLELYFIGINVSR